MKEDIRDKVIESLLKTLTYDEMTKEQEELVVEYETKKWKPKIDELILRGLSKKEIEIKIHEWWLDYQIADRTELKLFDLVDKMLR